MNFFKKSTTLLFVFPLLFLCGLLTTTQCNGQINEQETLRTDMPKADSAAIVVGIRLAMDMLEQSTDSTFARLSILEKKYDMYTKATGMLDAAIGKAYGTVGELKKAEIYFTKALLYTQNDSVLKGNIFCGLSLVYQSTNRYELSGWCLNNALAFCGSDKTGALAENTYNDIAILMMQTGRFRDVPYYFEKEAGLAMAHNDTDVLCATIDNLGSLYGEQKNWDKCIAYYKQALALARKYGFKETQYGVLLNLGGIYNELGMLPQERELYRQAAQLHVPDPTFQQMYNTHMGMMYARLNDYHNAIIYFQKALESAIKLGGSDLMALRFDLATSYDTIDDYKNASIQYKAYVNLKDSIQTADAARHLNEYEAKFHAIEKDKDLLQKKVVILQQRNQIKRKDIWLAVSIGGLLLLLVLLVVIYRSARQKRLAQQRNMQLMQQQQEINVLEATVSAEEQERRRIGRDLHDGVSGMLTATNINIATIQNRNIAVPQMQELDGIITTLQQINMEVRKIAHNLIPDYLLQNSLEQALQSYISGISHSGIINIELICNGNFDEMSKSLVLLIYRIIQELIQNIIKHSQASKAKVQITATGGKCDILVEDNGKGFDTSKSAEGLGLQQIKQRVAAMHGNITISSQQDSGTAIHIVLN